jgi:hypothetical protein
MLIKAIFLMPENAEKFVCENCDFKCSKKSNYNAHILTLKHKNAIKCYNIASKNANSSTNIFVCECGKEFKHQPSLSRHKKKCQTSKDDASLTTLVLDLVKSNTDLQQQMLEVCKSGTTTNNNNINNSMNNSNNKTFNLQLFLNETCKDAMNIMDFVDSIKFQLSDLESVGELGYINGLSKIIIRNLKALDENMRPVHCSDLKREKVYVKDAGKWEKECANNKILKNAIKYIAHKNVKMIPAFREKYPDCIYSDSRKSDQYNRLIIEAMGGDGDDEDSKSNKIISKIAKEIVIDKSSD